VPDNVIVVGTMNSSDRSVGSLDAALRRRFAFRRIWPLGFPEVPGSVRPEDVLRGHLCTGGAAGHEVREASIDAWATLNRALLALLGPDGMLGHSYLFDIDRALAGVPQDRRWYRGETETQTAVEIWRTAILPQCCEILETAHALDLLVPTSVDPRARQFQKALASAAGLLRDYGELQWGVEGGSALLQRARIALVGPA
jgi:hypothetical protein